MSGSRFIRRLSYIPRNVCRGLFDCLDKLLVSPPAPPPPKQDLSHINQDLLPIDYRTLDLLLARFLSIMAIDVDREGCENSPFKDKALREAAYSEFRSSRFTGFVAAFYEDGQLALFTYFINGRSDSCPQLRLAHGRYMGRYGRSMYHTIYNYGLVEDDNPWSDGIPPQPMNFQDWLEEAIASIAIFGLEDQLVETDKAAQELVADLGIRNQDFFKHIHTKSSDYISYRIETANDRRDAQREAASGEQQQQPLVPKERLRSRYAETFGIQVWF